MRKRCQPEAATPPNHKKAPHCTHVHLERVPPAMPNLQKLSAAKVPAALLQIVVLLCLNPALSLDTPIDAAELFAGVMSITEGMRQLGYTCVPMDIDYQSDIMNILSSAGFALALTLVLKMGMRGQGLLWLAPVCSTWVFMSSGSTQRSRIDPLGDTSLRCVREANVMYARCILLCWLADALGVTYILEQPVSSVMHYAPRFQELMRISQMFMASPVHMGSYGGETQKSLKLFSNREWVGQLVKPLPKNHQATATLTTVYFKDGNKKVTGAPGLKKSQAYPKPFGCAVACADAKNTPEPPQQHQQQSAERPTVIQTKKLLEMLCLADSDQWQDAELDEVIKYLTL